MMITRERKKKLTIGPHITRTKGRQVLNHRALKKTKEIYLSSFDINDEKQEKEGLLWNRTPPGFYWFVYGIYRVDWSSYPCAS